MPANVALLFFVASRVDLDSSSSSDAATNSYQIGGAGNADGAERSLRSYSYRHHSRPKRVVPPATSIPRFRKYAVDDFNFLKVLGKGSFGKVRRSNVINHRMCDMFLVFCCIYLLPVWRAFWTRGRRFILEIIEVDRLSVKYVKAVEQMIQKDNASRSILLESRKRLWGGSVQNLTKTIQGSVENLYKKFKNLIKPKTNLCINRTCMIWREL